MQWHCHGVGKMLQSVEVEATVIRIDDHNYIVIRFNLGGELQFRVEARN